jgi:serine protease Do
MHFSPWTYGKCLSAVLLSLTLLVLFAPWTRSTKAKPSYGEIGQEAVQAAELSFAFRRAADKIAPTLVSIETWRGTQQTREWAALHAPPVKPATRDNPETRSHESTPPPGAGTGTGFVIDRTGTILTTAHVVADADAILVRTNDGSIFMAHDVRVDLATDLAILRISGAKNLAAADLGDSDQVRVGDWAVLVGDPFGHIGSVSAGVISAVDRFVPTYNRAPLLQSDAATNPGSSGGPLLNLNGEVVGVNVGSAGIHRGFEGIGFSVPINYAKWIAEQLASNGYVPRPYFGCQWEPLTPDVAELLGLSRAQTGALVCGVDPNSPAAASGLKAGDVVTEFSNRPIRKAHHLSEAIARAPVGSKQEFTVLRKNSPLRLEVLLQVPQETWDGAPPIKGDIEGDVPVPVQENDERIVDEPAAGPRPYVDQKLGLRFRDLLSEDARALTLDEAQPSVLLTAIEPGGIAYWNGLCAGMAILQVDDQPVRNAAEFQAAIRASAPHDGILLLVETSQGNHFLAFKDFPAAMANHPRPPIR